MKVIIYWVTKDPDKIARIRERFGIGTYRSVNGETPAEIREEDMELLRETESQTNIIKLWKYKTLELTLSVLLL